MHGGVLTTLVDTACGYCGCFTPAGETPRRAVTLSLTTSFISTGQPGQRLVARARRSGGGKSVFFADCTVVDGDGRSEEHTSELQSLMRISYAVFCLKKKKKTI